MEDFAPSVALLNFLTVLRRQSVFTLAVSGFSATMNMKLMLTRSVPLQMQMMQPSKSASVFPMASNEDKILGSCGKQFHGYHFGTTNGQRIVSISDGSKLNRNTEFILHEWNMMQSTILDLDVIYSSQCKCLVCLNLKVFTFHQPLQINQRTLVQSLKQHPWQHFPEVQRKLSSFSIHCCVVVTMKQCGVLLLFNWINSSRQ